MVSDDMEAGLMKGKNCMFSSLFRCSFGGSARIPPYVLAFVEAPTS